MLYVEEEEEAVYARLHTCIVSLLYYYTFLCHVMTQSGIPNSGPQSWSSLSLPPHLFLLLTHTRSRARTHTHGRFLEEQGSRRKVKKARKSKFEGVATDRGDED
jgi:hypothetical protein